MNHFSPVHVFGFQLWPLIWQSSLTLVTWIFSAEGSASPTSCLGMRMSTPPFIGWTTRCGFPLADVWCHRSLLKVLFANIYLFQCAGHFCLHDWCQSASSGWGIRNCIWTIPLFSRDTTWTFSIFVSTYVWFAWPEFTFTPSPFWISTMGNSDKKSKKHSGGRSSSQSAKHKSKKSKRDKEKKRSNASDLNEDTE
jgi:hypothetical protein